MSRRGRRWNPRQLRLDRTRATIPTYPSHAPARAFRHRDRLIPRRRKTRLYPVHEVLTLFAAGAMGHVVGCISILLEPFGYTARLIWHESGVLCSMTFLNSVMGGFGVAAAVVTVLAISDGLSTWVFDGQTISSKVAGRIGGAGGA